MKSHNNYGPIYKVLNYGVHTLFSSIHLKGYRKLSYKNMWKLWNWYRQFLDCLNNSEFDISSFAKQKREILRRSYDFKCFISELRTSSM